MPKPIPIIKCLGSKAIEISWPETDQDLLPQRHQAAQAIQQFYTKAAAVNEGYRSLLVLFLNGVVNLNYEIKVISELLNKQKDLLISGSRQWHLPVFYDVEGADFLQVSNHSLLTVESVVQRHLESTYRVEFIGFLPGFPYLSGLHHSLHIPRKKTPSLSIATGSVAIAAGQCGIYPRQSPGGWYVLGKCPLNFFDVTRENPGFLEIGDQVNFYRIDNNEFEFLHKRTLDPEQFIHG